VEMTTARTGKSALVLSGGGLRGLAHVGAWRAIVELGLTPDIVIGTSVGGVIGGAMAAGLSVAELEARARAVGERDIAVVDRRAIWINGIRRPALLRGEVLHQFIERLIPARSFEELAVPLQVNAVNIETGELAWFGLGARSDVPLVDALCASAALPAFYPPVRIGDAYYLDGGVLDTLPIRRAADEGADWIIAIDVTSSGFRPAGQVVAAGMLSITERVFGLVADRRRNMVLEEWDGPRLTHIRPRVEGIPGFEHGFNDYLVDEGYRATRDALKFAAGATGVEGPEAAIG
jgi:NTE family protein